MPPHDARHLTPSTFLVRKDAQRTCSLLLALRRALFRQRKSAHAKHVPMRSFKFPRSPYYAEGYGGQDRKFNYYFLLFKQLGKNIKPLSAKLRFCRESAFGFRVFKPPESFIVLALHEGRSIIPQVGV